jgi:hypothetical protein
MIRGQGRPLDVHLISTASLTVHFHQPLHATLVMLCHSLLIFATVSCGRHGTPTHVGRDWVASAIAQSGVAFSSEAADIIVRWRTKRSLNAEHYTPEAVAPARGDSASRAADVAILWAINELDEHLAGYTLGFTLAEQTPSEAVLRALDCGPLQDAIVRARWLRRFGRCTLTSTRSDARSASGSRRPRSRPASAASGCRCPSTRACSRSARPSPSARGSRSPRHMRPRARDRPRGHPLSACCTSSAPRREGSVFRRRIAQSSAAGLAPAGLRLLRHRCARRERVRVAKPVSPR